MELEKLYQVLDRYDKLYDEQVSMVVEYAEKKVYHSRLPSGYSHSTLTAVEYALALLDGGRQKDGNRACDIIDKILSLQDTNEEHDTFGLWSYYLEEPLEQMDPPDWNWADFIGKNLLRILMQHKKAIGTERYGRVMQACKNACKCIMRRNMGVQYTNVVLVDAYITIVVGELAGEERFVKYGSDKLKLFWAYTQVTGGLNEFNSPMYTLLVAKEMVYMIEDIKLPELADLIQKINDIIWRDIATHFYYPQKQWSGPHARAYTNLLSENTLFELGKAAGVDFGGEEQYGLLTMQQNLKCPEKYVHYFKGFQPFDSQRMNTRGSNYPWFVQAQVATTYNTPQFSLASFNCSELWNQIRPLIGYFGGKCLRVRLLHDFYDFSSGQLHCVQKHGSVLGCINVSTDRGDTHVSLDFTHGTIRAKDLRVRFQLEGKTGDTELVKQKDGVIFKTEDLQVYITVPYAKFGTQNAGVELNREQDMLCFDIVWYAGEEKMIALNEIEEAVCLFGLLVSEEPQEPAPVQYTVEDKTVHAVWKTPDAELGLEAGNTPEIWTTQMLNNRQTIDGVLLEELAPPEWV